MANVKTPVVLGNARFTVYSSGCVRLEYAKDGRFSPYPSLLTGNKPAKPAKADAEIKGKKLKIRTDDFTLHYEDNGQNFSADNLKIEHRNNNGNREVWQPGKHDRGNLGSVRRCLDQWQWCGGPEHYPVEGILSTDGGHLVFDEPRVYWNTKHDWPECLNNIVWFDGYFFAYGDKYKQALKDFVTVFGRIPMLPRWAFGFWYSRWYAYTDKEVVGLVEKYRKNKIPIDVMIIDTDWRDGWGGYDWSKKYFPKPEKLLKQLRDMNVHSSLNDHPGYGNYDALPENDSHIPVIEKKLGALPHQGQWACDWSNKKAIQVWKDDILGPFFDQGMDFWWIDGWIKGPFGSTDSQYWANRIYYELAEERLKKRGMILARWGGIGSHRYPVQFSGDTASEWGVLKHQVEFTARSGNLGAAYWSHDIGGFFGRQVDEEILIRWMQFGAMSPILRTHSDHGDREPWKYSDRVMKLFRKQVHIRYALAPYFYTLAREAHDEGLPIVRPLYLDHSHNDGGAMWRKHQYMLGGDLLVVPADEPVDKKTGFLRKRVYFPKGRWYALESDEVVQGTQDRWIDIPLDVIPTFVREGAILPCQTVGEAIGCAVPEEIHFDYYPDSLNPSKHVLYEDDGETKDYLEERSARLTLKGCRSEDCICFSISEPDGSYRGMPKKRDYVVRVLLNDGDEVKAVCAKVGKAACADVKHRIVRRHLAGTVSSGRRFCEIAVSSANKSVDICVQLK